jgi:hypothetical protein
MTELPAKSGRRKARELYSGLNVLRTESKAEFAKLLGEISQYIEPNNPIEEMYVNDIASDTWDIMRYRRVITGILNNAFRTALARILRQIMFPPGMLVRAIDTWLASENLAYDWLFKHNDEIKRRVLSLLQEAGFDESAIEAEAYRLAADDLAKADRMLKAAQDRRDKDLRMIAKLRKSLAQQLRRNSDRVLAADKVPSIASDAEV